MGPPASELPTALPSSWQATSGFSNIDMYNEEFQLFYSEDCRDNPTGYALPLACRSSIRDAPSCQHTAYHQNMFKPSFNSSFQSLSNATLFASFGGVSPKLASKNCNMRMPFSSHRRCNLHAFASVSPGTRTDLQQHMCYVQPRRTSSSRTVLTPSTHARKFRYVGTRPGIQTLKLLLPSSSSSTCFLLHHHVGQEWAPAPQAVAIIIVIVIDMFLATTSCWASRVPRPSSMGLHGPGALVLQYYPVLPLGGLDHTQLLEGGSYKTLLWLRGAAPNWPHT
jgi:hypothetical protein